MARHESMALAEPRPVREVRAVYDNATIRVYQAYSTRIALPALDAQKFVPPFSLSRMTWIKPSFTWMMYRSGWGSKPGQERILAVDITRTGFEWALARSCLSHFDSMRHASREEWETALHDSPVRIQWDPERDLRLNPLPWRAIQVGLGPMASIEYVENWIVRIEDITSLAARIRAEVENGNLEGAAALAPVEKPYPLPKDLAGIILSG